MRVLFLTHAYPRYSGDPIGSFVARLVAALRSHGIESTVLAPAAPGLANVETIDGTPVLRYRYAPTQWETLAYTGTMGAQVRESWKARVAMAGLLTSGFVTARRLAREQSFDLLHAHWWFPSGLIATGVHSLQHLPLVTTLHGSDVRFAQAFPGGRKAFRVVARASAAMTTVSSWLAEQAAAFAPGTQPIVAPMPVRGDLFHPPGEAERVSDRLLFIGKLSEQKGLQHLLRALALMNGRPTVDVVGAGRVDDSQFRSLADELELTPRINWLPLLQQEELAALYRRATIHVIPALEEGLGLTAVESLLCETPVVAFDSGGVPDVVVPDTSGVLVPPGDVSALAAALDRLLGNPHLRARLGALGRAYATSRFSPDAVAERYAALYQEILTRRPR